MYIIIEATDTVFNSCNLLICLVLFHVHFKQFTHLTVQSNNHLNVFHYTTGTSQGRIQGGGGRTRRAPPKIGKNMIFWRKIVIFHTKYPQNFRAPLRSAQFFLSVPPP
jgi:hypothetical protein